MFHGKAIKEKIKNGKPVVQVMLRFASPEIVELMALNGVDIVIIDNEHYPFDPQTMIAIARAVNAVGGCCVARLPNAEPARIAQVMDMGIDGVWLPSCENYEEARALVDGMKFPPVGKRGFCPIVRSADYGKGMTPSEFAAKSNEESLCFIQIESKSGVEDLDRILSIEDIDSVAIGPSDLSASYGFPGDYNNPIVTNAIKYIKSKTRAVGKCDGGMFHTAEAMAKAVASGEHLVSIGSDQQILMNRTKLMISTIQSWRENHKIS